MMKQINMAEIKLRESEIAAAVKVLRSGALRQGKECHAFEAEFSEKVGAKYAVASSSGSAALHLAYMCFLEPGDEVLVPSFTFIATASMVTMASGTPIFCDVDPESYLIDLIDAERRITPRTRAIAPVHLFGNVCDPDKIRAFAKRYNLLVVWDAAQSHGATFKGRDVGSFDDFVCFSFYPSKNMFVGEGGMTCTSHPIYAEKLKYMRTHGQTGKYHHTMLGLNYRMTDVEAAIGRKQLARLDEMLAVRRRNAKLLNDGIAALPGIRAQHITPHSEHAWHQYCVVVDPSIFRCSRDQLAAQLNERGISTAVHYPKGAHQQPIFQELYGAKRLPATESLTQRILALPVHHGLGEEDAYYIRDALEECYDRASGTHEAVSQLGAQTGE